ncbi:MAG: sulfite exporter TauE/SafE family protein [Deltaproteobacteria bacterium]|nr:sulfite exporter TauE/SafE family protein [Deltaproteobacteria bacterium]
MELFLFPAGVGIASVAMTIGIGGGILWMPLLILAYGVPPQEAVSISLMIQVAGMGSGSLAYSKVAHVEKRLTGILFLVALPGIVLGSLLTVKLPENQVNLALGAMSLILALVFISGREELSAQGLYRFDKKKVAQILPIPAFFGLLMGFLSVGVGEWLIPSLKNKLNMEMTGAVATVIHLMFLLSLVGAMSHGIFSANLNWGYFFWGALGAVCGGQIAPRFAVKVSDRLLKEMFVYLMTLTGIHLIFHSI